MKYRGFSSISAYCANRHHDPNKNKKKENTKCPSLLFNFNNIISPNNADVSTKMRYANAIKFANKTVSGRVTSYKC